MRRSSDRATVSVHAAAGRQTPGFVATFLLLLAVVAIAAHWRFTGFDWDEGSHLHPDERFLVMVTSALEPVDSFHSYLDTRTSTLNPNNRGFGFFVYGNLPVVTVHHIGRWLAAPGNEIDRALFGVDLSSEFAAVRHIGRAMSAIADVLVTVLVFAVGAGLYGRTIGLLSSALYAGAVLPIQQAHFFTVDAVANLFVAIALWLAVRAIGSARWSDDLLFGVALGAGAATKLSIGPAFLLLVVAVAVRFGVQSAALGAGPPVDAVERRRRRAALLVRSALSLNLVILVAALTFRLLQPYAFVPTPRPAMGGGLTDLLLDVVAPQMNDDWTEQMTKAAAQQSGDDDTPPNHQWATRVPLLFALGNMVRYGLGWPLGLLAWGAWSWALVEGLRGRAQSWRHVLLVAWVGLYTAWYGAGWVASMRYLLPVYPALAILAAWALVRLAAPQRDPTRPALAPTPAWRRAVGTAAAVLVLGASHAWAAAFTSIYARPHTRIAASRWIYENAAADLTLTIQTASGRATAQVGLENQWVGASSDAENPTPARLTRIAPDSPATAGFSPEQDGRLTGLHINGTRAVPGEVPASAVEVHITGPHKTAIHTCDGTDRAATDAPAPSSRRLSCGGEPIELAAEAEYDISVHVVGGSLLTAGATIANEGSWDDAVPLELSPRRPWQADYQVYGLEMAWEDDEKKRERLQSILDRAELVTVSSNRFYDSLRRNPRRWPMTMDYYDALFSGRLGFALAAEFSSLPRLGPWYVDDSSAEEAFSVYDHPRVFVFRKTAAYSAANTAAILGAADLDRVERMTAARVSDPPAVLPVPPPFSAPASGL